MPKYKDIKSMWQELEKFAVGENASDEYRNAMRTSFYAAAASTTSLLLDMYTDSDPAIFLAVIKNLLQECNEYFQDDFRARKQKMFSADYTTKNKNKN